MGAFTPSQDAQLVDVPLSLFGGLNTEVSPVDLPEGLSPDNQDMAFVPGDTHSRPCLNKLFATPFGATEAVYGKSYTMPNGGTLNLFMDGSGKLYFQDVDNSPTMYALLAQLPAGTKAQSASAFGREYIALSDLIHGKWPPLQYDGTNLDRVTQDGPAVGPTAANVAAATATIANSGAGTVYNISTVTPSDPVVVTVNRHNPEGGTEEEDITYYTSLTIVTTAPNALAVGTVTSIAGVTPSSFNRTSIQVTEIVNTTTFKIGYHSTSTATGTGGTATVQNPSLVRAQNVVTAVTSSPHGFQTGWQVKIVMANLTIGGGIASISRNGNGVVTVTMTSAVTIPIGATVCITGVTNPDGTFNGTFTVASVLSSTVFTYAQGGAAANSTAATGNVQDVFSTTAFIQSIVDSSTFTYRNIGPDDLTNASGTATILGQISPGAHRIVVSYLTRQGALTVPSPPITFPANGGQQMILSDLPIGPSNVVARLIGLTGAGGANYFVLPSTPQIAGNITGTSTLIPDNTSTSAVLDFSDNTLFAGIAIDQPGNDLFDQRTLSPGIGFFAYGSRLMFWGDFNRVENLLNMTLSGQISYVTSGASATTGTSNGSGAAWTNPTNITSTASYADVVGAVGVASQQEFAQGFGLAVAGIVAQIKVSFNYYYTATGTGGTTSVFVQLLQAGVAVGTVQVFGLSTSTFAPRGSSTAPLSASFVIPVGSLVAADLNNAGFGFQVQLGQLGSHVSATHLFVNNGIVSVSTSGGFPPGWSTGGGTSSTGVVIPSNLPGIQALYQMTSAGGLNDEMISQQCVSDAFGTTILLPNTRYSFALYTTYGAGISGLLTVDLFSPTAGQLAVGTVNLAGAKSQFQFFDFAGPTPAVIPSDSLLRVYLATVTAGAVIGIAELSLIYSAQPYNNVLARTSYVLNPEGFAQTTGNIGSQDDSSPVRCFSIQRNGVLLKTAEGTHVFQQNDFEPSAWVVDNLSRSVGACSIRAGDPGRFGTGDAAEDWDLTVNQNGWYLFAGGDFWRISQEIARGNQQASAFNPVITWNDVDWARQHLIWVKNDVTNRRVYCGAPINGQSQLETFVLDYRELDTASDIANAPALKIGFSGKQLSTDKTRKWSRWTISANMADTLLLPGNDKQVVFCGATRNGSAHGNVYTLDETLFTDDDYGAIQPYYTTYAFLGHDMEQALGMGSNRKLVRKISAFVTGIGYVSWIPYIDSLSNPQPATNVRMLDQDTNAGNLLDDDLEWTVAIRGDRIFFRCQVEPAPGTTDVQLKLQKLIIGMQKDVVATRRSSDL